MNIIFNTEYLKALAERLKHLPGKHNQSEHGRKRGGGGGGSSGDAVPIKPADAVGQTSERLGTAVRWDPAARKKPVKVTSVEEAYQRIADGDLVELDTPEQAYTMIKELGDYVKSVETSTGRKLPNLNLCKVSVPGTNLFCGASIATDQHPEGVPRAKMPQLSGKPREGSDADALPKSSSGEVNIAPGFIEDLRRNGIKSQERSVPASQLKASQSELKGTNVSFFLSPKGQEIIDNEIIYVSRDGYVIDGHHRWAGKVAQDLRDGKTGDVNMRVRVIDMPIMEVLDAANDYADRVGLLPKGV